MVVEKNMIKMPYQGLCFYVCVVLCVCERMCVRILDVKI